MDRRRFLKYAGVGAGLLAAGAAGYYVHEELDKLQEASVPARTATTSQTSPLDMTLPVIQDLKWTPTRVVNDKVYDGEISLITWDMDSYVESITVDLVPAQYSHLPKEAFPQEDTESFASRPARRVAGFEQEVRDIEGGREYEIRVTSKDARGNVATANLTTPYVREFENTAPLNDITVIADYYTWFLFGRWGGHVYTPLLGEYGSGDPTAISKHIDWATGHGIDAFAVSWWGDPSSCTDTNQHPWDLLNFEERFLKHPMLNHMKFCILYENNGRLKVTNRDDPAEKWVEDLDDPFNRSRLLSDFEYLTKYFSDPQYLRIGGKPCVRFDYTVPFRGDIKGVLGEVRTKLRDMGWEIYLINDLAGRSLYPADLISAEASDWRYPNVSPAHVLQVIENTDAIGGSGPPPNENYKIWRDFSVKRRKDFVPVSWPGQHVHPSICPTCEPVPRSPEYFTTLLEPSIKYNTRNIIEIAAFNEWEAGIEIEPAEEYGFSYLQALRDVLGKG